MVTLDQYKLLVGDQLRGLSEKDVRQLYEFDTIIASYALKTWLARRCNRERPRDRVAPIPS